MPTLFRKSGLRFYFYSSDGKEPPHVHITGEGGEAKFWILPIQLEWSRGFGPGTLLRIESLLWDNQSLILEKWNEFFDN